MDKCSWNLLFGQGISQEIRQKKTGRNRTKSIPKIRKNSLKHFQIFKKSQAQTLFKTQKYFRKTQTSDLFTSQHQNLENHEMTRHKFFGKFTYCESRQNSASWQSIKPTGLQYVYSVILQIQTRRYLYLSMLKSTGVKDVCVGVYCTISTKKLVSVCNIQCVISH